MKKNVTLINDEKRTGITSILGWLLIVFSLVDFALSFLGVNLTSFLGSFSKFTPVITGLLGSLLINSNKN